MRRLICCLLFTSFSIAAVHARQEAGPSKVVRPRTTDVPDGVKVVGCVQAETRPNAFRLVVSPPPKEGAAPALPSGVRPGAALELIARGETNLQPMANQKVEVTGKLSKDNKRLEVLDARPLGACDAVP
jgi:hypothetical protein